VLAGIIGLMERESRQPGETTRGVADRLAKGEGRELRQQEAQQRARQFLIFENLGGRFLHASELPRDEIECRSFEERLALDRPKLLELEPREANRIRMLAENKTLSRIHGLYAETWELLSTTERLYVLSEAEHVLARFQNRSPCRIRAVMPPHPTWGGCFYWHNKLILINENLLDIGKGGKLAKNSFYARTVLWHEADHRLQREAMKAPNDYRELGLSEIAEMVSAGPVPKPSEDPDGYKTHPCEVRSGVITELREDYLFAILKK